MPYTNRRFGSGHSRRNDEPSSPALSPARHPSFELHNLLEKEPMLSKVEDLLQDPRGRQASDTF